MAKSPKKKSTEGRIVLDVSPNAPIFYATHAEISHTPHDIGIAFGQLPLRLSEIDKTTAIQTGDLHVETAVQLIIPPTLLPELIDAMTIQMQSYEARFGKIRRATKEAQPPGGRKK